MIPIQNVKNRVYSLHEDNNTFSSINTGAYLHLLENGYNYNATKLLIENYRTLDTDEEFAFERALDLFEDACANDTDSHINELARIITEKVIPKFRTPSQIQTYITRKKGNVKQSIAGKVNKKLSNLKAAIGMGKTENNGDSNPVSKHSKMVDAKKKAEDKKVSKANECYDMFSAKCNELRSCDMVWMTHNKINKRFNLKESYYKNRNDMETCINELCMLIDTFDVPFRAKFNICLENIQYELYKDGCKWNKSDLAKNITEYFLMNGSMCNKYQIIDETVKPVMKLKLVGYAKRLAKNKNTDAAAIGNAALNILSEIKDGTVDVTTGIRNVVGKCLVLLGSFAFVGAIGAGVLSLIVMLCLGLLILVPSVAIASIISPDIKAKISNTATKVKGKKKRELDRVITVINKSTGGVEEQFMLREAFTTTEFMSNKYDMEHVLDTNKFYNKKDIQEAKDLLRDLPISVIKSGVTLEDVALGNSDKYITEATKPKSTSKAREFFVKLQNTPNKSAEVIKSAIKNIFSDSPDNIVKETPNIFKLLFYVLVIGGTLSISVGLGIITAMVTWFISMEVNRTQTAKYIEKYKKEKEKAEKRKEKMTDEKAKERCQKYIDTLDKSIEKLEAYEDEHYTEKENDERKQSSSDLDDDLGLDDDLDDLKESGILQIPVITEQCNRILSFRENGGQEKVLDYIKYSKLNPTIVKYISEACLNYDVIDKEKLLEALDYRMSTTRYKKFADFSLCNSCKAYMENYSKKPVDNLPNAVWLCKALESIMRRTDEDTVVLEMDFTNSLKMLADNVKRKATDLSDKEKVFSKTLDSSIEGLRSSMENALKQENKEAVIRGSILPPASRIIKLAITTGLAFLIHPALAVIGIVTVFALSKGLRAKERQIVLDEIDVEKKMTERYIEQAKDKNDNKALRQLYMIQKKLDNEHARLAYRITNDQPVQIKNNN